MNPYCKKVSLSYNSILFVSYALGEWFSEYPCSYVVLRHVSLSNFPSSPKYSVELEEEEGKKRKVPR